MTNTDSKSQRRHNKEWKDSTRNDRTRAREQALKDILQAAGWSNKSELLTAIINGDIAVPQKPR